MDTIRSHPFLYLTIADEQIPIAIPEKAMIDFLYLMLEKLKNFHSLPEEVEFSEDFDDKIAMNIIEK